MTGAAAAADRLTSIVEQPALQEDAEPLNGCSYLFLAEPNLRRWIPRGCRQGVPTTGAEPRVRLHVATVGQLDDSIRLGSVEQSFPILGLKGVSDLTGQQVRDGWPEEDDSPQEPDHAPRRTP